MTDASLSAKVTADIADFTKKFDDMRGSIDRLASDVKTPAEKAAASVGAVKDEIAGIGTLLKSGALVVGGAAITAGVTIPIINLGREAVMMADKLRQSEIAFTVMLGSAQKATEFLRELQAFAARTPFEFPELQQSAKKMLALGFTAEQVIPTLTNVGNAVSGLGGNAGTFDRIILALGQMQAKGQVMAQEMRQLAEAGIPAWQILADAIGVTVPQAMEMVTKKQVDSATAIAALQAGMAAKFGGLMEQQSQTIQGTLANLHDTVGFIMTDIGREIIETLKIREGLAAVQEFSKGFLDWFRQLDQGTKQVLLVLVGTFAIGGPILVAVGAFMAALAIVTGPMLVGGAIVAGIVAGVTLILLNWQKVKDTGIAIWTNLKDVVVGVVTLMVDKIYDNLVGRFVRIIEGVKQGTEAVAGFFYDLWTKVTRRSYVPDMVDEIETTMDRLSGPAMVEIAQDAVAKTNAVFASLQGPVIGASAVPQQAAQQTPAGAEDPVGNVNRQVQSLDLTMTSAHRAATAATVKAIETGKFTFEQAQNEMASVATQTWGSITSTVGNSFAQQLFHGNNWMQTLQSLGQTVVANFTNMALQMATQWLLSNTVRMVSDQTAAAATVASSAVSAGAVSTAAGTMAAANTAAAGTSVAVWGGAATAILGFFGTIAGGFAALAVGLVAVVTAVGTFIAGVLAAIAAALSATIFGIPVGIAILVGVAGILAALAATGNLGFEQGGIGNFGSGTPATLHGREAIIPLNDRGAGFMRDMLGVGDGLGRGGGPITIVLEVDGRQFGRAIVPYLHDGLRLQAIGR